MSKKRTPLWREAHFEVKMYKAPHVRATFGGSDVEKVHAVVARSTFRSQNVKNTRGLDHFWRFRCRFASLHYITLRSSTLHYTTLHYLPLHFTTLHYTTLHPTTLQLQLRLRNYTPLHGLVILDPIFSTFWLRSSVYLFSPEGPNPAVVQRLTRIPLVLKKQMCAVVS